MRTIASAVVLLLTAAVPALAQSNWFQPALLERPDVRKALQSVDQRSSAIVDEWIRLVEIPAPSRKEQARAQYVRAEMQKLGLSDIRVDEAAARQAGKHEGVAFHMEKSVLQDYSKARPKEERLNHPLVQTALAVSNHFRKAGTPAIVPADVGSTDAN